MTTAEIVMATESFKKSNNQMMTSISFIGVFENAISMKKAGFTYAEWLNATCAGSLAKQIVKEIYQS
jgi:hypothetical protein